MVVAVVLFPMYAYLRYCYIPANANLCQIDSFSNDTTTQVTTTPISCVTKEGTLEVVVEFPIFAITLMNWCGWILLMLYLPLGQWSLVFDNFFTFYRRPKPMKEDEFNRAKAELAKKVQQLLQKGRKLIEDKKQLPEQKKGWWSSWRNKRALTSEQNQFETNCILAEKEF